MPIKFYCQQCRQLLGIAGRKAGSEVQCPRCGYSQRVPTEEAAQAAWALQAVAPPGNSPENATEVVVFDNEPEATAAPSPTEKGQRTTAPSEPALQTNAFPPLVEHAGRAFPGDMILLPRKSIYRQAALLAALTAACFIAGYFIGRGDAIVAKQRAQAEKDRVMVDGKILYHPVPGEIAGDQDAVIIALPVKKHPKKPLSTYGLRPQDPAPSPRHKTRQQIAELGGAYARADAQGAFALILPRPGPYYLLVISRKVVRPSGSVIDELDLVEMNTYFQHVEQWIRRYAYRWSRIDVQQGFAPIGINFGESHS